MIDVVRGLSSRNDDLAAQKEEEDDGRVGWAEDEARKHVLQVGAVDVEVFHEGVKVDALVGAQAQVGVSDNVLDGDATEAHGVLRVRAAQEARDLVRRAQALQKGLAAGQHHLAAPEEQHCAVGLLQADGDGRKLLAVKVCVGHVPAHAGQVERGATHVDTRRADEVVDRGDRRLVDRFGDGRDARRS